jgi:ClpP class serine protease
VKFLQILSRVTGSYWFITQDALENITALLESRINGVDFTALTIPGAPAKDQGAVAGLPGDAVIPIHGVIGKRISSMEAACGGTDVDAIAAQFVTANSDANVKRIVLDINSPGGTVAGVPELAALIANTKSKPVLAVSDTKIGSAAYYIASAADEIRITPTADIGSIGCALAVRESLPGGQTDGKTRLRIFRSGADKMMGSDAPLTAEQAAHLQATTDQMGGGFRAFVARSRGGKVPASAMTGLSYIGNQAVANGLANKVYPSLSAALDMNNYPANKPVGSGAQLAALKTSAEDQKALLASLGKKVDAFVADVASTRQRADALFSRQSPPPSQKPKPVSESVFKTWASMPHGPERAALFEARGEEIRKGYDDFTAAQHNAWVNRSKLN